MTAFFLLVPNVTLRIILGIAAVVFVIVVLHNPLRRYFRLGYLCLSSGLVVVSLPHISLNVHLQHDSVITFVFEHSWGTGLIQLLVGLCLIAIDLWYVTPRNRQRSGLPSSPTIAKASAVHTAVSQSASHGGVNVNVQQGTISSLHIHPSPSSVAPVLPVSVRSNLPPMSPTFVPRPEIAREIHEAFAQFTEPAALRQVAARAYGGFGKTVASISYGHQYAEAYPGGRFFLPLSRSNL
jgi:hypothetical protein